MRRKLVAGNWKMNGDLASNVALLTEIKAGLSGAVCDVAVCVPSPYFAQCQSLLTGSILTLGAQDVSQHEAGAYTGEISAAMLQEFGCCYVIVGHSERRASFGETDGVIAQKTQAALRRKITPIICVGETLAQREAGQSIAVVTQQLNTVLSALSAHELAHIVIAYEPVWAIGSGKTATPDMAQEIHAALRACMAEKSSDAAQQVAILYGGSMKPENAGELLAMTDIDGGLIGGAALNAADFLAIIRATCAIVER